MLFSGKTEACKEDGNYEYKRKQFHKAIAAYTEGIKVKCDNVELNAILYTNRATAHFSLGMMVPNISSNNNYYCYSMCLVIDILSKLLQSIPVEIKS